VVAAKAGALPSPRFRSFFRSQLVCEFDAIHQGNTGDPVNATVGGSIGGYDQTQRGFFAGQRLSIHIPDQPDLGVTGLRGQFGIRKVNSVTVVSFNDDKE